MKHLHKSHIVSKSFAISIALICWAAAFINFTKDYKHSATQAVTAFSTSSINHIYNSIQITPINKTTYEISINNQNRLNKTELFNNVYKYLTTYYDRDINLVSIHPAKGSFMFIADYEHLTVSKDVVFIGIENAENFRYVTSQQYLFTRYDNVLFVSRYPQDQHRDLIRWLQSIPNPYVHFGDLDLAGIAIYEHEYYRHLGTRASFFVPDDYEQRIANGSTERYNAQLSQYGKMQAEDPRVQPILDCIHRFHKGYDQEGYISQSTHGEIEYASNHGKTVEFLEDA